MDKGSSDQNASTEVLAEEENFWVDLHPFYFLCHYGKSTTSDRREEDDDYF